MTSESLNLDPGFDPALFGDIAAGISGIDDTIEGIVEGCSTENSSGLTEKQSKSATLEPVDQAVAHGDSEGNGNPPKPSLTKKIKAEIKKSLEELNFLVFHPNHLTHILPLRTRMEEFPQMNDLQCNVIDAVAYKRVRSFTLHGPPGTGKTRCAAATCIQSIKVAPGTKVMAVRQRSQLQENWLAAAILKNMIPDQPISLLRLVGHHYAAEEMKTEFNKELLAPVSQVWGAVEKSSVLPDGNDEPQNECQALEKEAVLSSLLVDALKKGRYCRLYSGFCTPKPRNPTATPRQCRFSCSRRSFEGPNRLRYRCFESRRAYHARG